MVTTIVLVRHAERQTSPPGDPSLNEDGRRRAQRLAGMLAPAGVQAIITSQFVRTQETARPLAEALGLVPTAVTLESDNFGNVAEHSIQRIVDRIHESSGGVVLVVGHSNTVPPVIAALGGDLVPSIPENEFDNLFVVTAYAENEAKVTHLKY
jgi:broad specificity phosphatase PhoE